MYRRLLPAMAYGFIGLQSAAWAKDVRIPQYLAPGESLALVGKEAWADEFNTPTRANTIDPAKWGGVYQGERRAAINDLDYNPAVVSDGTLKLNTKEKQTSGPYEGLYPAAVIGTKDTQLFQYGYFETSVKLQQSVGNWSAFWLQSNLIDNRTSGTGNNAAWGTEIDIYEHTIKGNTNRSTNHALHWNSYEKGFHRSKFTTKGNDHVNMDGSFNTFGLLWTPDYYAFYNNSRLSWVVTNTDVSTTITDEFGEKVTDLAGQGIGLDAIADGISRIPQYMILSVEVGKTPQEISFGGDPAKGSFPDVLEVDYVRYYEGQRVNGELVNGGGLFAPDAVVAPDEPIGGDTGTDTPDYKPDPAVPDPSAALLAVGGATLALARRRRR